MERRRVVEIIVVLAGVLCARVRADTRTWTGLTSNDWFTDSNWNPTATPAISDTLNIYSGSPTASSYVEVGNGGSITFDGATASGTFDYGYFDVAYHGDGTLSVLGGADLWTKAFYIAYESSSSSGTVTVAGAGSMLDTRGSALYVAYDGTGALVIGDGGQVSNGKAHIGVDAGSTGRVTVDNATWDSSGVLAVGSQGNAGLAITGGGSVSAAWAYVARKSGSAGTVTVAGPGSGLTIGGDLTINNNGRLFLADSGQATVSGTTYLNTGGLIDIDGGTFNAEGNLTIDGGTLTRSASGQFNLSDPWTLAISNGGLADFAGSFTHDSGDIIVTGGGSKLQVASTLSIGNGKALDVSNGAEVNVRDGLISVGASGAGQLSLNGGKVIADEVTLGPAGTFTSTGASSILRVNRLTGSWDYPHFAGSLQIGHAGGSGSGWYGVGTYGSLTVDRDLTVGYEADGPGSFEQFGGTVAIGENLYVAEGIASSGTYALASWHPDWDGGRICAFAEHIGYRGTGAFVQSTGTNTAEHLNIGGQSTGAGTYELSGTGRVEAGVTYVGNKGVGTFRHTGGAHVPAELYVGFSGGDGTYELSDTGTLVCTGDECVGYSGTGRFVQTGGVNVGLGELCIGDLAGGTGTYELSGTGELWTTTQCVGNYGLGTLDQSAGTNTATDLALGRWSAGRGTYSLTGGRLTVGRYLYVGMRGTGTFILGGTGQLTALQDVTVGWRGTGAFTQTGGTHAIANGLVLGDYAGADGAYHLGGTGQLSVPREYVGYGGTGAFVQDGGTHTVSDGLYVGFSSGASGTYTLAGGALSAHCEYVGHLGTGTVVQTGGTNDVTSKLVVGNGSSGRGVYVLSAGQLTAGDAEIIGEDGSGGFLHSGGKNRPGGDMTLGLNAGAEGAYTLSGTGDLRVSHDVSVGAAGTGTFTQTGGAHIVEWYLRLGAEAGSRGIYALSGGDLRCSDLFISSSETATATFQHTGGTNEVWYTLLVGRRGTGAYELSDTGCLVAYCETVGYQGDGAFTQAGGTNTVKYNLVLGDETGSDGTYTISGGSLSAANLYVGRDGSGCLNVADAAAGVTVSHLLQFGPRGTLAAAGGATIHMSGAAFENTSTVAANLAGLGNLTLIFEGGPGVTDDFEVAGEDRGPAAAGWTDNFALGTLQLGGTAAGRIRLVDAFDNQADGYLMNEALYTGTLVLNAGAGIDRNGLRLYYLNGGEPKEFFRGDANLSGDVDVMDLCVFANHFGCPDRAWAQADFNGDGKVDVLDLTIFANHFGSATGGSTGLTAGADAAPIPEPATLSLLALGFLALARRRRR